MEIRAKNTRVSKHNWHPCKDDLIESSVQAQTTTAAHAELTMHQSSTCSRPYPKMSHLSLVLILLFSLFSFHTIFNGYVVNIRSEPHLIGFLCVFADSATHGLFFSGFGFLTPNQAIFKDFSIPLHVTPRHSCAPTITKSLSMADTIV